MEQDYDSILSAFAKSGQRIINLDPKTRYVEIGKNAKRKMEPGYIPIDGPARVMAITFYPNETELPSGEFSKARQSFEQWGRTGSTEDYRRAFRDFLATLPEIRFYRKRTKPVFDALDIPMDRVGWLPLIKCPLPAGSAVPEQDVFKDRMLLWDQLNLLRPSVMLCQGVEAYETVRHMCRDKFPHSVVLQKISQYQKKDVGELEIDRVIKELRAALSERN